MKWEAIAAVAASLAALASFGTLAVAIYAARNAYREFALTKRPLVVLDNWTTRTLRDAHGRIRVSLYARIRDAVGIPTVVHHMACRTSGFPPGYAEPETFTQQVVKEPLLLFGDELTETSFLGWVMIRQVPENDGRGRWVATGRVDYRFSTEGSRRFQDWSVTFRVVYAGGTRGGLPRFLVRRFASERPGSGGKFPGKLRETWERWKRWNCRVREM